MSPCGIRVRNAERGIDDEMLMKRQITVQPRGIDRWAAQEIGSERSQKLYELKGDAVAHALAQAKWVDADLVIEDGDGRIERWESHGADQQPRPT